MFRFEYATTVQQNHPIVIPQQYTKNISDGSKVRIYIHVDEPADIVVREKGDRPDEFSLIEDYDLTLEEFTEKLMNRPYPKHLIKPGDGRLVEYLTNPVSNSDEDISTDDDMSLEEFTAELMKRPSPEHLIKRGDGRLAEYLANPVTEPEPDFDVDEWNREWQEFEAQMKAESFAKEQKELEWLKELVS